jgi:uncharacterized SAM-binding protein YcdF (DUF218 family)
MDLNPLHLGHRRRYMWLLALAAVLFLLYLAITAFRIAREADRQNLHRADAIVVFGAAEYSGHPSPVFRARLDHAFELFAQGLAPVVITTGGAGADPSFSEGGVGHDYLMHRGIPEQNLIAETLGSDTAQSAERVGVILRANGMRSCLAVSDEYHVFRIRELLEHEGITVYVAPRPGSRPKSRWQRLVAVSREAISYLAWKMDLPL